MALRQLLIRVTEEQGDALAKCLEGRGIEPIWHSNPNEEDRLCVLAVMDALRTEGLIQELSDQFSADSAFRITVMAVEATYPPLEEDERGGNEPGRDESDDDGEVPARVAIEELREKLREGAQLNSTFLATVVLSTIVAAVGLIEGSTAVVIGAMVIAPLLGPNMALALGTTLGDIPFLRRALACNLVGVAMAFLISALIGTLAPVDATGAEISSRTVVTYYDILLALAAGTAGALAFTTGVPAALVGVMVAVALLPPVAVCGLLVGQGDATGALRALHLVTVNVIGINLAAVATFLAKGIRPRGYWKKERAGQMVRRAMLLWTGGMLILAALLWAMGRP